MFPRAAATLRVRLHVVLQFSSRLTVLAAVRTMKADGSVLPRAWLDVVHQLPVSHQFCFASEITAITDIAATVTVNLFPLLAVAVFIVAAAVSTCAVAGYRRIVAVCECC